MVISVLVLIWFLKIVSEICSPGQSTENLNLSLFYIVHHFVKMHRGEKVELRAFLVWTLDRGE